MSGPYLLFAGERYYPSGGWDDFIGLFATMDEARATIVAKDRHVFKVWAGYSKPDWRHVGLYDWAHIVHDLAVVDEYRPANNPSDPTHGWQSEVAR